MHVLQKPATPPTSGACAIAFGELAGHNGVLLPQKGGHLGSGDAVAEANGRISSGRLIFCHASTLCGPTKSGMRYPLFLRMRTAVISDIHGNLEALLPLVLESFAVMQLVYASRSIYYRFW